MRAAADQQDRHFRRVDDRRRVGAADRAEVADRERAAAEVFELEACLAGRVGDLASSRAICGMLLRSASRRTGTTRPLLGVDGDADVDVLLVNDLLASMSTDALSIGCSFERPRRRP